MNGIQDKSGLTDYSMAAILYPSISRLTGIETPNKGHKRPQSNVVFLYPSKHNSILLWWAVLGNPLEGWPVPLPVVSLDTVHRPKLETNGRRFIPLQRNTAMNTPSNTQAQTEQNQNPTIDDLHRAFAQVCFYYGCIIQNIGVTDLSADRLRWLSDDANELAAVAMQLHANKGGVQ